VEKQRMFILLMVPLGEASFPLSNRMKYFNLFVYICFILFPLFVRLCWVW
jgi:hypothetical protein